MEELTSKHTSTKWAFNYAMLPKGGLVFGNVMHEGYNLARDMRVVRIWVYSDSYEPKSFYLNTDELPEPQPVLSYLKLLRFDAPPPFDTYTKRLSHEFVGYQARYRTKKKVFDDNDDADDYLEIEQ